MKKVISAVLAGAMVAGAAFADPAITLKFRLRPNLYDQKTSYYKAGDDSTYKTTTALDMAGHGAAQDDLIFKATTDYAGVDVEAKFGDPVLATQTTNGSEYDFTVDKYYGWMNWGALKFTGGNFDQRFIDKMTIGATSLNLTDDEGLKMGVWGGMKYAGTSSVTVIGTDSNNLPTINGSRKTALVGEYSLKDLPGDLTLKAGVIDRNYKKDTHETDSAKYTDAGYGFEADYAKKDVFGLSATLKFPEADQTVLGVFGRLDAVKNLTAVVGFTYAKDSYDSSDYTHASTANKHTEMAFDARAKYNINEKMAAVGHFNYSMVKPDNSDQMDSKSDAQTGMYIVGDVSYVINDLMTAELSAGYYATDLDDNDKNNMGENYIVVEPSIMFTAGKGAFISTGLRYQQAVNTGDCDKFATATAASGVTKTDIAIPMVFRVQL